MPEYAPVDENHPAKPINYYGFTKLACERIIDWYSKVYGIDYISLRYFNIAGDCGLKYIDPSAKNILPIIMEVLSGKRDKLVIFGKDYDTPDGTCVRDYIDINDLVRAHMLALNKGKGIINLGTSKGFSVKELVDSAAEVTGKEVDYEFGPRRKGDPAKLVASNKKAFDVLGWRPEKGVKDMIKSTYEAYKDSYDK